MVVQSLDYIRSRICSILAMHQASGAVEGKHSRTRRDNNLRVSVGWPGLIHFTSTQKCFLGDDTMKTQKES